MFVRKGRPFDRQSFERALHLPLDPEGCGRTFEVTTAEDIVLHKLEWFRLGGEVSERQWADAVGVLAVQRGAIDLDYLRKWADELGVRDLLDRAVDEAAES